MATGTVKFFNESKGFGFIVDSKTGEEFFIHISELFGLRIQENDVVTFEVTEGKKGLMAVNVAIA
jgi:cold shock protein